VNVKRARRLMRLMGLMKPIFTGLRNSWESAETPEGVASL